MSDFSKQYKVDSLDLAIIEKMLIDGRIPFKELAKLTKSDQRTVASRFDRMMKFGIIKRSTIEVDWSRLGLTTTGYIGSTTALGKEDVKKLFDFISKEPRIIEADTTIGAHEYFLKVIDLDIKTLRAEICAPLEPLTVDLTTSIITNPFKLTDYTGLLKYLKKRILD